MKSIDKSLLELGTKYNVRITRYADDIVFSGTQDYDQALYQDLLKIFEGSSLDINKEKNYFADSTKGQRLKVHGLLVKDDKIALTKGYRKKLRTYKYLMRNNKINEKDMPRINGHIKFSEFIESKSLK